MRVPVVIMVMMPAPAVALSVMFVMMFIVVTADAVSMVVMVPMFAAMLVLLSMAVTMVAMVVRPVAGFMVDVSWAIVDVFDRLAVIPAGIDDGHCVRLCRRCADKAGKTQRQYRNSLAYGSHD